MGGNIYFTGSAVNFYLFLLLTVFGEIKLLYEIKKYSYIVLVYYFNLHQLGLKKYNWFGRKLFTYCTKTNP